ncbi:MAG: hypothetical protein J6O55_02705 [Lachnospiraceae bacterium]|nr:hypothetical protein [Lachnospiraceae bacterium]
MKQAERRDIGGLSFEEFKEKSKRYAKDNSLNNTFCDINEVIYEMRDGDIDDDGEFYAIDEETKKALKI